MTTFVKIAKGLVAGFFISLRILRHPPFMAFKPTVHNTNMQSYFPEWEYEDSTYIMTHVDPIIPMALLSPRPGQIIIWALESIFCLGTSQFTKGWKIDLFQTNNHNSFLIFILSFLP